MIGTAPDHNATVAIEEGDQAVDMAFGAEPMKMGVETKDLPAQKLFSFEHTGVIVTGGARGLGLCMATALLEALAPYVYCLDILPSPVEEEWQLAEQASKSFGGVIEYHQLDITDGPAVTRVMSQLFETCPVPIAAFFGAAGIQQMIPAVDYPAADFRRIMDVNVTGTFLSIQAVAKEMIRRKIKGSIAMTASMSGTIANKGLTCLAYNTSKSALLQMARSAAAEWGVHGIRVNTLSPGYILTAMTAELLEQRPDLDEEWLKGSMLERLSTPDEYRGPVIFLLSKASSFMTGADLIIDGGHTAY